MMSFRKITAIILVLFLVINACSCSKTEDKLYDAVNYISNAELIETEKAPAIDYEDLEGLIVIYSTLQDLRSVSQRLDLYYRSIVSLYYNSLPELSKKIKRAQKREENITLNEYDVIFYVFCGEVSEWSFTISQCYYAAEKTDKIVFSQQSKAVINYMIDCYDDAQKAKEYLDDICRQLYELSDMDYLKYVSEDIISFKDRIQLFNAKINQFKELEQWVDNMCETY